MKALLRSLLSLLFLVSLIVGVLAAVLLPISGQRHLALVRVTERAGPLAPPPGSPDAPPVPTLTVEHQTVGVNGGRLLIGCYLADDEARVNLHVPGTTPADEPLSAGLHLEVGPAAEHFLTGGWYTRESSDSITVQFPLFWLAVTGLTIAVIGYGSRALHRFFTTQHVPSSVCLHCNQHYEDPDAAQCPHCQAPRPQVTVTKPGRPL